MQDMYGHDAHTGEGIFNRQPHDRVRVQGNAGSRMDNAMSQIYE
jgi:hypothetical protein